MPQKQLLIQIRRATKEHITLQQIAEAAHVSTRTEYLLEIGGPVNREEAERVLAAFSRLAGAHYSLENVQINIRRQAWASEKV